MTYKRDEPKFLKRSAPVYMFYGGQMVFSIIVSVFIKPLFLKNYNERNDLVDPLVGLPILGSFVLAPLGGVQPQIFARC